MVNIIQASRVINILGNKVFVFDDILSSNEVVDLSTKLSSASFSMNAASGNETIDYNEVMTELDNADFVYSKLYRIMLDSVELFGVERENAECYEVLVNCNRFGGYSFMHQDIIGDGYYSALYYINDKWEDSFGGETLFCNDDGEPLECVTFKPGRLVLFPSKMKHIAGIPTEISGCFRYTLSVRLKVQAKC